MQTNKHIHTSLGNNDECYTPRYAVEPLLEFMDNCKNKIIWCPFDTEESEFVKVFRENNFNIVLSHVKNGQNFLNYEPQKWDLIISNPPFTDKRTTFERCLSFKKPFALLMTILWLNDKAPKEVFYNYDLQLLLFDERIEYKNQKIGDKINFASAYYCYNFLPKQILIRKLFNNKNQMRLF